MRRFIFVLFIFIFVQQTTHTAKFTPKFKAKKVLSSSVAVPATVVVETMNSSKFGKILIYKSTQAPTSVAFLVSDITGWNNGMIQLAKLIQQQGALVIGLDFNQYMHHLSNSSKKCYYPAADFEALSMLVQKKYKIAQYHKPVIIGVSEGSALTYATFTQAPANTFGGVIAIDFRLAISANKSFCLGSGLKQHQSKDGKSYIFDPVDNLSSTFIALEGTKDPSYQAVQQFIKNLKMGQFVALQGHERGLSDISNWQTQLKDAYTKIVTVPSFIQQKNEQNKLLQSQHLKPLPDSNLPLVIIPSGRDSFPMVFMISGDGGWTSFDQSFGESLARKGLSVIGLDAQKYFWNEKTPEETTNDITKAVAYYMSQWHKTDFVLVGYSFGACVAPFIAARFSPAMKKTLKGVFCFSADEKADFEIHIADMMSIGSSEDNYNVLNEAKLIKNLHPVFVFGQKEDATMRMHFVQTGVRVVTLPGNHHYDENTNAMADVILRESRH